MFVKVENKGRYKTSNPFYWHTKDQDDIDYLFTDSALIEAEKRASKNPEDIPDNYGPSKHDWNTYFIGLATGLVAGFACTAATYFLAQWIIGN
jgi:hypothetical protein